MTERPNEPAAEALTSAGLVLNIAAVLAFAVGLAGLTTSASAAAAATLAVAVVLFGVSLACFAVGSRRLDARRPARVTPCAP